MQGLLCLLLRKEPAGHEHRIPLMGEQGKRTILQELQLTDESLQGRKLFSLYDVKASDVSSNIAILPLVSPMYVLDLVGKEGSKEAFPSSKSRNSIYFTNVSKSQNSTGCSL